MALDRRLSRNFWLHEFPCWERASEADVLRLQPTVAMVLQPVRDRWGKTVPTSWMWWRDGCTPRQGPHGQGGTVDFVTLNAELRDVWEWGRRELMPAGYLGRWIFEPAFSAPSGDLIQGAHIHAAPRVDMQEALGIADVGAYEEVSPGEYQFAPALPGPGAFGGHTGQLDDPVPLAPVRATVSGGILGLLLAGAAIGSALENPDR